MNWEKHECSLLEVFSDVGSTPTASTISIFFKAALDGVFAEVFRKTGVFLMAFCGVSVVDSWCFRGFWRHTFRP
jgi:hypothetical protein